uniref:CSON004183 protein n=1 Tax=Culicoides sonorensis TaxID=179676 RepID=A0A336LTG3_CULSO
MLNGTVGTITSHNPPRTFSDNFSDTLIMNSGDISASSSSNSISSNSDSFVNFTTYLDDIQNINNNNYSGSSVTVHSTEPNIIIVPPVKTTSENTYQNSVIIPLYAVIFGCCVIGNLLVILTLAQNKRMRTVTNVYLLNLLKWLLQLQPDIKSVSAAGKSIILRQSFINALETGNSSHIFPIPLNERKRTVIFSSWRSGSTFIGDIFNILPGNYYHYEPFNYRSVRQIETDQTNIDHVKNLLQCNYDTITTKKHMNVSGHWHYNFHMASYCNKEQDVLCRSVPFREAFCNIFPRQNMKLVRARISLAEHLLNDTNLNVNVILQVRDPRAVTLSRRTLGGCNLHPDCYSMQVYCKHLVEDYHNAKPLLQNFPKRFKVLRFEDLAMSPFEVTEAMFNQFGIPFDDRIIQFLEEHTKSKKGGMFSTFRDSKAVISQWTQKLNMTEVEKVQSQCLDAMKLWGYNFIQDESQLNSTDFDPIGRYSI